MDDTGNMHNQIIKQNIEKQVMKKTILFAAIVLMAGFSTTAMAAGTAATVTATAAGAKLIVPMTLTETSPLHFGTITLPDGTGGTVLLTTANARTFTGAGVVASAVAPLQTNAAFNVTGTQNVAYALTLPATITVTETVKTTATMTISALTVKFSATAEQTALNATSVLSAGGTDNFIVGGTLTVGTTQVAGIYAGTFPVSVDYN